LNRKDRSCAHSFRGGYQLGRAAQEEGVAGRLGERVTAILVADVVGYSRLAGADEERILARLRALRSDLFDPTIALHHGRVVKRTGDGIIIEFRSVVDAVRCAIEVQSGMVERNAGLPTEKRIGSASAFISATWSRRATATSWAMGSISPRD
jgi:class 3 adenylate cyclase